jgi:tripartite-type tricarboxylate transporter receptor subunit TctC
MRKIILVASVLAGILITLFIQSPASAQADFYKGKTITIIVGTRVTGTIGQTAQLIAHNLGRFIPGNPTVILQQMPGGAHLNATNHVYNVRDADGLTILAANPAITMAELAKVKQVRFDVRQIQWLGSTGPDGGLLAIRSTLPYKSFKEFMASGRELVVGATGPGSNSYDVPLLLKEFAGAKFKILTGFRASGDIRLALERGEADVWTALATPVLRATKQGKVRPLVRGRTPIKGYPNLPVDENLTTDPVGKALLHVRGTPLAIGKPYGVRPGTPADRVAILREAFTKTMHDPQFIAQMNAGKLELDPIGWAEVTEDFNEMMSQPPNVVAAIHKYLLKKGK